MTEASMISPAFTFTLSFSTVTVPSAATSSIFSAPSAFRHRGRLLAAVEVAGRPCGRRASSNPPLQAPMRCGCLRAYCFTGSGGAAVGIALAQHRVHRAAQDLA
jgi:hypothetical protein